MKILHVIGDASLSGGPSHVLALSWGQHQLGHDIEVISPTGPLSRQLKAAGFVWHETPMRSAFDRKSIRLIWGIVSRGRPEIVHCHGIRGGWLGRLATRKIPGQKVIYSEHLFTKEYHLKNPVWENFQLRGMRFLDRYTSHTIAVSGAVKEFLIARRISRPNKVTVVYNGIDWNKWNQELYDRPASLPIVFGSVGSLHRRKGYDQLIAAIAVMKKKYFNLPNFHCQIIGEGPERSALERQIQSSGLAGKITLRGRVDEVLPVLRHFSFYLQPSRDESFGVALVEAMALGLPPLVTKVGGMKEVVEDQKSGLIVPAQNPRALADGIYQLLANPSLRRRLGLAAKRRVKAHFTLDRMAAETIAVYKQVLAKHF